MSEQEHALPTNCPNCGAPVHGPFCAHCGQKVQVETPTLFEFLHEYLHHYVALEGTLTRSLWLLLARPGKLTTEFIAGRRARYVKPLQLYVTISFIFFILLGAFGSSTPPSSELIKSDPGDAPDIAELAKPHVKKGVTVSGSGSDFSVSQTNDKGDVVGKVSFSDGQVNLGGAKGSLREKLEQHLNKRLDTYRANPDAELKAFVHDMYARLPYAVFIMMPLCAALLQLVYLRRHMRYGAHLVFTLHLHAFIFLVFLALLVPVEFGDWLALGTILYLLLAQRRVYGGRWIGIVLRTLLMVVMYAVVIGLVILGLAAYTALG